MQLTYTCAISSIPYLSVDAPLRYRLLIWQHTMWQCGCLSAWQLCGSPGCQYSYHMLYLNNILSLRRIRKAIVYIGQRYWVVSVIVSLFNDMHHFTLFLKVVGQNKCSNNYGHQSHQISIKSKKLHFVFKIDILESPTTFNIVQYIN